MTEPKAFKNVSQMEDFRNNLRTEAWESGKCPIESTTTLCASCLSPHFSIDTGSPRRGRFVPGRCDDCGYTWGEQAEN